MGTFERTAALVATPETFTAPENQALGSLEQIAISGMQDESASDFLAPVYGSGAPDPAMVTAFFYVDSDSDTPYFRAALDPSRYVALNPQ